MRKSSLVPRSLKILARSDGPEAALNHCRALLGESGESIGGPLAAQTLSAYRRLDAEQHKDFFFGLLTEFGPDSSAVREAAKRYAEAATSESLWALGRAAKSPRQELLLRLNQAPGGTLAILQMREHLLGLKAQYPQLGLIDCDFQQLLSSWFNPGFLQLVRVDWKAPAELLDRLVQHERVHEIHGWTDLRRRLEGDRCCYAFFHPALPGVPLVFVEVALIDHIPAAIGPLLDPMRPSGDPGAASVAVFYSISNCQPGLRGVSLGNFLIKQVVEKLSMEFSGLRRFCTLSPIPGFTSWLRAGQTGASGLAKPLHEARERITKKLDWASIAAGDARCLPSLEPLSEGLLQLCAAYLLQAPTRHGPPLDAVARFHLGNGARIERLNWAANVSPRGLRESLGLMVNYLYEPLQIERNFQRFKAGDRPGSRRVKQLLYRVRAPNQRENVDSDRRDG